MGTMTYPDTPYPEDDGENASLEDLLGSLRMPPSRAEWTQQARDQAAREGLEALAEAAARPKPTIDELLSRARLIGTGEPEDPEEAARRRRAIDEWEVQRQAWLATRSPAEIAAADQKRLELPNGLTMDENDDLMTHAEEFANHMREVPDADRLYIQMRWNDRA
jgi:hypothetical protein